MTDYTFFIQLDTKHTLGWTFSFLSHDHLSSVTSCSIGPILLSDHSPVYLQLSLPQQTPSTGDLTLQFLQILKYKAHNNIRQWLEQYRQDNAASPVTPAVVWDAAKAVIRGQLISYTSAKQKTVTKQTEQLKKALINLEQSPTEKNRGS